MSSGKSRTTQGRGRLYESVVDTIGDTPCIRINALAPNGVRLYAKSEFFNRGYAPGAGDAPNGSTLENDGRSVDKEPHLVG